MRFSLSDLAVTLDGRMLGDETVVDGVSTDSRSDVEGRLFVPLVAERDGHDFIKSAIANGAGAYLTAAVDSASTPGTPALAVADTAAALTAVGREARRRLTGPVIGITGSVGKTSVKDLTAAACGHTRATWASRASFNNEIGVPLTLANAPEGTEVTIVEMGARGIGHIAELCQVARPTVGIVTCVALAHSELFGSIEGVARGKGELIESLPADGTAVLNADDPLVAAMAERTDADVVTFGTNGADVIITSVTTDRLLRPTFTVRSAWGNAEITLEVRGAHMAMNSGAAIAAALAVGTPFDDVISGLASSRLSPWRMEVAETDDGVVVVNDAYNANPTSVRAALDSVKRLDGGAKVAVLGIMAELGVEGPAEHRAVAAEAAEAGFRIIAVDAPAYGARADHVSTIDQAFDLLGDLDRGDVVLVKGSRVAELETLAERLLARA